MAKLSDIVFNEEKVKYAHELLNKSEQKNKTLQEELNTVLKKLKTDNKEIYILNPKNNVKKIFTITGLDKIFKMEG